MRSWLSSHPAPGPALPASGPGRLPRVLLADDAEAVRERLRTLIDESAAAHVVGEAATLAEALAAIERAHPDVVLFGLRLRDGRGRDALARLRREHPQCRVIVLTNFALDGLRGPCAALGADCVIEKARDFERVPALLARLGAASEHGPACDATPDLRRATAPAAPVQPPTDLTQVVLGIVHDFNHLVGGILGHAALAHNALPPTSPARVEVERVLRVAERARGLVGELLEVGRPRREPRRTRLLAPLVADAFESLKDVLPAGILLNLQLQGCEDLRTEAEPQEILRLVTNLGRNAWQALEGGTGLIEVGLAPAGGGAARLWVRDTGCGMDERTMARLLEPFFSTRGAGEGHGLGLAVVVHLLRGLGGTLRVDSRPGAGSCFELTLPAAADLGASASILARQASAPDVPPDREADTATADASERGPMSHRAGARRGPPRVLLVEDDDLMAVLCGQLLRDAGFEVETLGDGLGALQRLRRPVPPLHLLVTDVELPRLSGLNLARLAHRVRPGLPVLLASGHPPSDLLRSTGCPSIAGALSKARLHEDLVPMAIAALVPTPEGDPA